MLFTIFYTVKAFVLQYKIFFVAALTIFVLVSLYKGCFQAPPAKLDEAAILKAQNAIALNDRQTMVEVLAASDVAEKQIDVNLANAENAKLKAFHEARKAAEALSNDQLAAELNRRAGQ